MRSLLRLLLVPLAFVLAGCATTAAPGSGSSGPAQGPWTFTTSFGTTITLDERPDVIVVDSYSAAALWEYGIRPKGVYGYGIGEEGGAAFSVGNADLASMTVVGLGSEMSVESLAALQPDLVIGFASTATSGASWQWWNEQVSTQVTKVAPFLGINFGAPTEEIFQQYADLAKALGADLEAPAVLTARTDYEQAKLALQEVAVAKPDLTTLAVSGAEEQTYIGTTNLSMVSYLNQLGIQTVQPDPKATAPWATVSWELLSQQRADVVLEHAASAAIFANPNPVYKSLPAVKAGQIGTWDDKAPYTYIHYAAWLNSLVEVYRNAEKVT